MKNNTFIYDMQTPDSNNLIWVNTKADPKVIAGLAFMADSEIKGKKIVNDEEFIGFEFERLNMSTMITNKMEDDYGMKEIVYSHFQHDYVLVPKT